MDIEEEKTELNKLLQDNNKEPITKESIENMIKEELERQDKKANDSKC